MVGHIGDCLGKVQTRTSAESSMHSDHRGDENNSNKQKSWKCSWICQQSECWWSLQHWWTHMAYEARSEKLGIGHNQIWTKADKVYSKFSMIKDHVTLGRTFSKYRIVIPTKEEWGKTGPINLGKGMSDLQMEPVISKELGQEFANTKAKYSGTFHWDRMLQPFRQGLRQYQPV